MSDGPNPPRRRWFGTDGVRDLAGQGRLAPDVVRALGQGLVRHLQVAVGVAAPRVVLGRDPRPSGADLEAQLAAGMRAAGARIEDAGLLPTPALAWIVARERYDLGVMLSASHNPPAYNGVKPFLASGRKLTEAEELSVEAHMATAEVAPERGAALAPAASGAAGYASETARWLAADGDLAGRHLVVDLAAGAATATAPEVLAALGAEVTALHPAGSRDINADCGSEHPAAWLAALAAHPGALGLAFDGDADRVVVADETGVLLDGDDLLAILARDRLARDGALAGDCVVSTVMSNLGLEELLAGHGVRLERAPVGDRYVTERMREVGAALGGEPSGHVVLARDDVAPAGDVLIGDALVAGVRVLQAAARLGAPLSALRAARRRYPQLLVNVRMAARVPLDAWPAFQGELARQEAALDGSGRLVVRYSGTEPLLRIMGEGREADAVERAVHALADVARHGRG